MANTNPIIVVHGIQGSWLKDEYPVNYQHSTLWSGILYKKFEALHLHSADRTVDADPHRLIGTHQAVPLIYEALVEEIREEFGEDRPYVYMFTYDWRKDNRLAAEELAEFVQRVLKIAGVHERAKKPPAPRPKRVNLIGHSMGGVVIKWYVRKILGMTKAVRMIDKIITIATPYGGSLKAIEALLPGARNLFGVENKKSMRHAARTMPGIYQLLPTWPEAVVRSSDGKPLDIFSAGTWQKNLIGTLRDRYGRGFFKEMLADAQAFTSVIKQPWPQKLRRRVYAAYGIKNKTWWQVPVDTARDNFFRFDKVQSDGLANSQGGDGTVHSVSSLPTELPKTHRKSDESEFKDMLAGHHANMPNHSGIQDWILAILGLNENVESAFESPR